MHIVVGYDGSNASKDAITLAQMHANAFDAKVSIVASKEGDEASGEIDLVVMENEMEKIKADLNSANIECEAHILIRGLTPGEDIVKFAKDTNADEIIVGVKKRSRIGKLVFGSTAQFVILEAPCPVVTVQ